ncbi:MAG: alpha/beta fold hydrolase, partial [Nannocystaceae bacterium]
MSLGRFHAPRPADRSKLYNLSAGRIYVCDRGPVDAPILVLLHGLLVHHYEYSRLIPLLEENYRVIAPDLMGCGNSD